MTTAETTEAVRTGAGLFCGLARGLIEVRGGDRVRFLDGQLTHDITTLAAAGPGAGCYALALTPQGRIAVDAHVLVRPDGLWLELAADAVDPAIARLDRYLVADDVELVDRSADFARLGLEGPRAAEILGAAAPGAGEVAGEPDGALELEIAGSPVVAARFGWSGELAFQLVVPAAAAAPVIDALRAAGAPLGLVEAGPEVLEVLRVEAGIPRFGAELDEEVLPAEAQLLDRAVSFTKGCYTGQEVVARMHSRGRVSHHLVGLAITGVRPESGAGLAVGGKKAGEVTTAVESRVHGTIALGYVRAAYAEPGTELDVAGGATAFVAALPFHKDP